MREINHNTLSYGGQPGETGNIRVEANGTNHMVRYVLDGVGPTVLPTGQKLTFKLKNAVGGKTVVHMDLDYSADGTYQVIVENVSNCLKDTGHKNECSHSYDDFPDGTSLNFSFVAE